MDNSQIESSIVEIRKRNGSVVKFNNDKISNAIYAAFTASSKADRSITDKLTDDVAKKLVEHGFSASRPPSVEDIQDLVESILIEKGHSDIAKAYILYRHEHRKLRDEKIRILNAKTLDPVAKKFDINSLRVLASRYLLRNNKSEINESPSQLFERVAILVGIGDLFYDNEIFSKDGNIKQNIEEAKDYLDKLDNFNYKFKISEYYLNKWHFRALINHYILLAEEGQMKVGFKELLIMMAANKFESYGEKISEYYTMMTSQNFLPNSPTMMNAGGRLG